jgi:hypothetical protein
LKLGIILGVKWSAVSDLPIPIEPLALKPQHQTSLADERAQVTPEPAVIDVTAVLITTFVGVYLLDFEPFPNCPQAPLPQQNASPDLTAQV